MRKIPLSFTAVILLAVLLLAGCRKYDAGRNPSTEYKANIVDSLQAVSIAARISPENVFNLQKPDANNKIESGITVKDNQNNPAYYIFSLADTGFIIISADRNLNPLLAYSTTSKFRQPDEAPPGVQNWLAKTREAVEILRKGWYDNHETASRQWSFIDRRLQNSAAGPTAKVALIPPPPEPTCETYNYFEQLPMLPVTWGQGCTYNDLCPAFTNNLCGRAPTGCVATAMAQIMAYWQHPTRYNWANMPVDYGNYDLQELMLHAGLSVNMQYGPTASGAYVSDIDNALRDGFQFSSATHNYYSESQVISNLIMHRPVILAGDDATAGGHAWVCDGYWIQSNPCTTITWMHMNWGWHEPWGGDDYNGFFFSLNWIIHHASGTLEFKYYKETIVNIFR